MANVSTGTMRRASHLHTIGCYLLANIISALILQYFAIDLTLVFLMFLKASTNMNKRLFAN